MTEIIEVHGLYARSWKGVLNEASFVHPAKISFNLAEYIYRFAIEKGMLAQGSSVLDCFGGIGGTAFHAMVFGMNWYGVELEQKFVELGQANIEAWNKKYASTLPNWGSASLVQGDSRKLGEVLGEKCDGVVSSPPFVQSGMGDDRKNGGIASDTFRKGAKSNLDGTAYGSSHGQLGNLPEGKLQETLDAAISSPPYAATMKTGSDKPRESDRQHRIDMGRDPDSPGSFNLHNYSQNEQNLGNLKEGSLDGVVSSPPYAAARIGETSGAEQVGHGANYGGEVGQLGGLKDEGFDEVVFDVAVSSPPYASAINAQGEGPGAAGNAAQRSRIQAGSPTENAAKSIGIGYGESEGQLSNLSDAGFTSVFNAALSSPPFLDGSPTSPRPVKQTIEYKEKYGHIGSEKLNQHDYGAAEGQLGKESADTFWSASKTIVSQVHGLLKPGGFAFFVVKNFVRKKAVVNFVGQWQQLCEACGFETLYEIRAWQVDEHGTQQGMEGQHKKLVTSRKSFFRRLHESHYPETAIDYEVVLVMRKVELPTLFDPRSYHGALPEWGTPTKVEVV